MQNNNKTRRKIPTLSLFSGAGGLDLGFEAAGFDIRACVELEKKYCDTLLANIGNRTHFSTDTKVHNVDILEFDATQYREAGIELVVGGPPCQTFSAAGRRAGGVIGTSDLRGQLYARYCEILNILKPRAFVFENVYGLRGANGGQAWQEMLEAFSHLGYELSFEVLDAADYGVPQHRERLILVGAKNREFSFPLPTHGPDAPNGQPLVTVRDAINDIQDAHEEFHDDLGGLYGNLLPKVPPGLNYSFFTAEMGHPEPVFAWRSKFHDLLYKVNPDEPSRTIKAQPGKFTGPFHWKNRHFTLPELKRLQSFPDDYELIGSYGIQLEQIGNSVPPRLASVIAMAVREQIFERTPDLCYPIRPENFVSTFRRRQRERSNNYKHIAQRAIEKQYGQDSVAQSHDSLERKDTLNYYVQFPDLFSRKVSRRKVTSTFPSASVGVCENDAKIVVDFVSIGKEQPIGLIKNEISGLRKYLPSYEKLIIKSEIRSLSDIFHIWKEIEHLLTERSQFFTLIDIYGHYANRGEAVNINSGFSFSETKSPILKTIDYFSQSENCGNIIELNQLAQIIEVSPNQLPRIASMMRELRYDFRTSKTHPIIGESRCICTYPFPLLSPRALVESRAKFVRTTTNVDQVGL